MERTWMRELRMGVCPRHGTPMNEVCGEYVCGKCYGERLLREPLPKGQPRPPLTENEQRYPLRGSTPHPPKQ